MSHTLKTFILSILFFIFLISCTEHEKVNEERKDDDSVERVEGDTLHLGSISNVVQNEVLNYSSFMKYLADSLKSEGIVHVDIQVVRSLNDLVDLINKNKIDLYTDSPYPVCAVLNATDFQLFMKHNKAGVSDYRALIFTRNDSKINSPKDLVGKVLGFEKSYSTSGFILPYIALSNDGYKLHKLENITDEKLTDKINYIYTGDDENTMYWVFSGRVDAGATDNVSFDQNAGAKRNDLKIIYETADVPRSVLMVNPKMKEPLKNRIYELLINMNSDSLGRAVLKDFFGSSEFTELTKQEIDELNIFNDFKR